MAHTPTPPVETPRAEPEIIPPVRRSTARNQREMPVGGFVGARYGERVFVGRVGPGGLMLAAAVLVLLIAAAVVFVIGALLVWIPVILMLVGAGVAWTWLRRYLARLR